MSRFLVGSVAGTLLCGLLAGCGQTVKPAPANRPGARPPAPAPVSVTTPTPAPAPEVKDAVKNVAESDPLLARLGLTADQAKKINDLTAAYAKKSKDLPDHASDADFKAVIDERNAKVREALTPDQQTRYEAGLKIMADYSAKVTKLQQTNIAEMHAVPKDQPDTMAKRMKVRDDYKAKRAVLDAEGTKAMDEAVGKGPALSQDNT
ncbi:MAG TPA: hypothetical protein VMB75_08965 [Rhodocyclaceae bacterium]|nr:hypothetical protein [Rhodocyclaceae bacterium]